MREIKFEKTYEEFKIGGKVYRMEFNDEAIKRYKDKMQEYDKKAKELVEKDENASEEEHEELFDESINLIKDFIDEVLGEGSFDELYKAGNYSSYNIKLVLEGLAEFITEKSEQLKAKKVKHYKK